MASGQGMLRLSQQCLLQQELPSSPDGWSHLWPDLVPEVWDRDLPPSTLSVDVSRDRLESASLGSPGGRSSSPASKLVDF